MDPLRNGFVHERGPLEISAAALDRLMGIIDPAGLDSCRLAIGRGMIVLPADDVAINPSQLRVKMQISELFIWNTLIRTFVALWFFL